MNQIPGKTREKTAELAVNDTRKLVPTDLHSYPPIELIPMTATNTVGHTAVPSAELRWRAHPGRTNMLEGDFKGASIEASDPTKKGLHRWYE